MTERASDIGTEIERAALTPWTDLAPQMRFANNYTLIERVGRGSFGEVWRGVDVRTPGVAVAIKIFHPNEQILAIDWPQAARRFYEGAIKMRRLAPNPRVVEIVDGPGIHDHETTSYIWFAMPLLEGDLAQLLQKERLSIEAKTVLVEDIALSLCSAHKEAIRHRDVRPQNILIRTEDGKHRAVLSDFDIAYYDSALVRHGTTIAQVGDGRYIPHDISNHPKATPEDREAARELMRDYSVDTYALSMVTLEVFCGLKSKPQITELEASILSLLRESEAPTSLKNRILRVCRVGLLESPKRYARASDWLAAWHGRAPLSWTAKAVVGLGYALLILTAAVVTDWAFNSYPREPAPVAVATLCGLVLVAPSLLGVVKLFVRTRTHWLRWYDALSARWLTAGGMFALSLAVLAAAMLVTDPCSRINSFWVRNAEGCRYESFFDSGEVMSNAPTMIAARSSRKALECPDPDKVDVILTSWLSARPAISKSPAPPPPPVTATAPPPAVVIAPRRLMPVQPLTETAIWEQLLTATMKKDDEFERYVNALVQALPTRTKEVDRIVAQLQGSRLATVSTLQVRLRQKSQSLPVDPQSPIYRNAQWRALFGHSAVALLRCGDGLFAIGEALHHNGHSNAQLWIADAIRCLTTDDGYQAVLRLSATVALSASERELYHGTLIWVVTSQEKVLGRRGLRWRAARLLDLMKVEWDAQRTEVLIELSGATQDCQEASEILISAKMHLSPPEVVTVESNLRASMPERRRCPVLGWR